MPEYKGFLKDANGNIVMPGTSADKVTMANGSNVETALTNLKATLDAFLTGEDNNNEVIDRLVELVAAINANKGSIDALVADKVAKADIVNDLTTGGTEKVLSAEQGKALKALIDPLTTASHTHENKATLDKFSETDGTLKFDGTVVIQLGVPVVENGAAAPANLAAGALYFEKDAVV